MSKLTKCVLSLLLIAASAGADDIRKIALVANDIIYDPFSRKIYASVPSSAGAYGNSITVIDPVTGTIGPSVFIGSEPGKLALAHNGTYLYASLDGAAAVRRFHIPTLSAGLQFPLGSHDFFGLFYVEDLEVMPGNPDAIAVSRMCQGISPRHQGVAIYDNGIQRPVTTPVHTGSNVIEFSAFASRLYGFNSESSEFGFRRMAVDASGVTVIDSTNSGVDQYGADFEFDGGLIYFTTGQVFDPENKSLLGTFTGIPSHSLVRPDSSVGRAFFLVPTSTSSTYSLKAFAQTTYLPQGMLDIDNLSGDPRGFIRWGSNGFAFCCGDEIVLIRTSLVPKPGVNFTAADADGDSSDEILADLWTEGIWIWDGGWTMLSGSDPDTAVPAEMDGDGNSEIAIDFGPLGLWAWDNGGWTMLTGENPDGVVAADVDGDTPDELAMDFGILGVWLCDGGAWAQLTGVDVDAIVGADLDGNGDDEVVVDAGSLGLWAWDSGAWAAMSINNPEAVISTDMDSSGDQEIIGDFGFLGLWLWDSGGWSQLTGGNAEQVILGDVDCDGESELVGDFGLFGVWLWNGTWSQLSGSDADSLLVADVDGDGAQEIIAGFGTLGLWIWDSAWSQVSSVEPKSAIAANIDSDLAEELVVDFGDTGVWLLDGGAWSQIR